MLVSIATKNGRKCVRFAERKSMNLSSLGQPLWHQNFDKLYLQLKINEKRPTTMLVAHSTNCGRNCDLFLSKCDAKFTSVRKLCTFDKEEDMVQILKGIAPLLRNNK